VTHLHYSTASLEFSNEETAMHGSPVADFSVNGESMDLFSFNVPAPNISRLLMPLDRARCRGNPRTQRRVNIDRISIRFGAVSRHASRAPEKCDRGTSPPPPPSSPAPPLRRSRLSRCTLHISAYLQYTHLTTRGHFHFT